MKRAYVVAIAGGSGSGKSTLTNELVKRLGADRCSIFHQDDYYKDQGAIFSQEGSEDGDVNFDDPMSLDFSLLEEQLGQAVQGDNVEVPCYDFEDHVRLSKTNKLESRPFIIVEGTMILHPANIRNQCALAVFLTASEQVRFERRLKRDIAERGRTEEGVRKQFSMQVKPMHDKYVEPTKKIASVVCDSERPIEESVELVLEAIPKELRKDES